nr:trypsin-like peptidase domain-containing protein [uncultured Acidocella sp.]
MKFLARPLPALFLLAGMAAHAAPPSLAPTDTQPLPPPLADLAAKVGPAVVSIASMAPVSATPPAAGDNGDNNDDGSDGGDGNTGFHPAADTKNAADGGVVPPPKTIESLGSGFVFDPAGYILTNHHVVNGASDVTVTFPDGTVYPAIIAGVDKDADLAVLKINAGHPLPYVPFGNSAQMRVGDWVLAIGNPFGMPNSNTAGIISALHRQIGDTKFDDFIQTDAAINKGNSGGPLFNLQGQVIGVNSAIYSPSGTSDGIGFSIPSAMAEPVAEALAHDGKMQRGWLGVAVEDLTPQIQTALKLSSTKGVLVGAVDPHSPAAGKLRPGDVITAISAAAIDDPQALTIRIAEFQTGQSVSVDYVRDGKPGQASLVIQAPPAKQDESIAQADAKPPAPVELPQYGLGLAGPPAATGVSVLSAKGPAEKAGIVAGDVIEQVNGVVVASAADLRKQVQGLGQMPAIFMVTGADGSGGDPGPRWIPVKPGK